MLVIYISLYLCHQLYNEFPNGEMVLYLSLFITLNKILVWLVLNDFC